MIKECEKWAKLRGLTEFAIDCEFNNYASVKFHQSLGFDEVNVIRCFTKKNG